MDLNTRSSRSCTAVAAAVLFALSAGFVGLCARADQLEQASVTVKFGDLNLSSSQGATTLYRRIVAAAHEVCDIPSGSVGNRWAAKACLTKAIADAVTKVRSPELVAIYNAHNSEPLPVTVARR